MNEEQKKEYMLALENTEHLLRTAILLSQVTQDDTGQSVLNVTDGASVRIAAEHLKTELEMLKDAERD